MLRDVRTHSVRRYIFPRRIIHLHRYILLVTHRRVNPRQKQATNQGCNQKRNTTEAMPCMATFSSWVSKVFMMTRCRHNPGITKKMTEAISWVCFLLAAALLIANFQPLFESHYSFAPRSVATLHNWFPDFSE